MTTNSELPDSIKLRRSSFHRAVRKFVPIMFVASATMTDHHWMALLYLIGAFAVLWSIESDGE